MVHCSSHCRKQEGSFSCLQVGDLVEFRKQTLRCSLSSLELGFLESPLCPLSLWQFLRCSSASPALTGFQEEAHTGQLWSCSGPMPIISGQWFALSPDFPCLSEKSCRSFCLFKFSLVIAERRLPGLSPTGMELEGNILSAKRNSSWFLFLLCYFWLLCSPGMYSDTITILGIRFSLFLITYNLLFKTFSYMNIMVLCSRPHCPLWLTFYFILLIDIFK